jgi:hypothetical protein
MTDPLDIDPSDMTDPLDIDPSDTDSYMAGVQKRGPFTASFSFYENSVIEKEQNFKLIFSMYRFLGVEWWEMCYTFRARMLVVPASLLWEVTPITPITPQRAEWWRRFVFRIIATVCRIYARWTT